MVAALPDLGRRRRGARFDKIVKVQIVARSGFQEKIDRGARRYCHGFAALRSQNAMPRHKM
jgi:hypothetical protein